MLPVKKLYTIGQVSQITGISSRMLRYYEKKEILMPAERSPENNYRLYTEKQLEELLLFKELNRVGFSMENLINIFEDRDLSSLQKELENKIQLANKEILDAIRNYVHINELHFRVLKSLNILQSKNTIASNSVINLIDMPDQEVVFIRYYGLFNSREIFMEKVGELYRLIKKYNLFTLGPLFVIFHDQYLTSFNMVKGDVEICVPLENTDTKCPNIRTLKAFRAISHLLVGPYSQLETTYKALELWGREHNFKLSGSSLEEYVVNPTMTSVDNNYATQIYLPIIKD